MDGKSCRSVLVVAWITIVGPFVLSAQSYGQNYERYAPPSSLEIDPSKPPRVPEIPDQEPPEVKGDDRILVDTLDAVRFVDSADKIIQDASLDDLEGIHHDLDCKDSILYRSGVRRIVSRHLGKPITLYRINTLAKELIEHYRRCKLPIVDVQIPEQRITGGTLHLVVIESRVGQVRVQPGCYFDCKETSRWIECTQAGRRIYEPHVESDLLWLNQNPFRRVTVDFEKGLAPGTTDVFYQSHEVFPLRGYTGIDDTGVETLNYGRLFAGVTYGNFLGRGGILGYQFTTDQDFSLLKAHSLSYTQPINRSWSSQAYGSWAKVKPQLGFGLNQDGESWQTGWGLVRHLVRNQREQANFSLGIDFKSTNNNLEFAGSTIAGSNADLLQLRFGYDHLWRGGCCPLEYRLIRLDSFIGPGSGFTSAHNATAFNTIRPGTSPDYIYGRIRLEDSTVLAERFQCVTRLTGQASSERLLFSETLGIGGYDTLRGFDQRQYNADHGWIANFELGPCTARCGCQHNPRSFRPYLFTDLANGYLDDAQPGEDAHTFAASSGIGMRLNVSDRFSARLDWGYGWKDIANSSRNNRVHFGFMWTPGPRP